MKIFFFTVFAAFFLSACGGGGSVAPPSTDGSQIMRDPTPVITYEEQQTARTELSKLRDVATRGGVAGDSEIKAGIAAIEERIDNADSAIEQLLTEIRDLLMLVETAIADSQMPGETVTVTVTMIPPPVTTTVTEKVEILTPCAPGQVRHENGGCTSRYDTAEYRLNYGLSLSDVLYAYDRGYFGQGVVIASDERIRAEHEEFVGRIHSGGILRRNNARESARKTHSARNIRRPVASQRAIGAANIRRRAIANNVGVGNVNRRAATLRTTTGRKKQRRTAFAIPTLHYNSETM